MRSGRGVGCEGVDVRSRSHDTIRIQHQDHHMAVESSRDLPLGTKAPDFALPDTVSGRTIRLADFAASPALLVAFLCNHCPYVIHVRPRFVEFAREFQPRGLAVVAISANDPDTYPPDGPEPMKLEAKRSGFTFS